jgi:hypothetical protein
MAGAGMMREMRYMSEDYSNAMQLFNVQTLPDEEMGVSPVELGVSRSQLSTVRTEHVDLIT